MITYPKQAEELIGLLHADQEEKREVGKAYFSADANLGAKRAVLKLKTREHTRRMFQILDKIGEPSLSNIGSDAAQAVSVLAIHGSPDGLRRILTLFTALYAQNRDDTYYQAIPSMTDCLFIMEHKPQRFGTVWLFDGHKKPFLPPVEDFEYVNDRRAEYGIEPFRWPKSLAIPESEQPWLKRPLSELEMREPSVIEYDDFMQQ
jgi:hypothetical protein